MAATAQVMRTAIMYFLAVFSCLYCLHCQVRYRDKEVCPVCIKRARRAGLPPRPVKPGTDSIIPDST